MTLLREGGNGAREGAVGGIIVLCYFRVWDLTTTETLCCSLGHCQLPAAARKHGMDHAQGSMLQLLNSMQDV